MLRPWRVPRLQPPHRPPGREHQRVPSGLPGACPTSVSQCKILYVPKIYFLGIPCWRWDHLRRLYLLFFAVAASVIVVIVVAGVAAMGFVIVAAAVAAVSVIVITISVAIVVVNVAVAVHVAVVFGCCLFLPALYS